VSVSRPVRLGSPAGIAVLAGAAGLLLSAGLWLRGMSPPQAPPPASLGRLPDFTLRDSNGRAWTQADFRGSVWVADFDPPGCASCVARALRMADLQAALARARGVRLVTFVTDRDLLRPGAMAELGRELNANPRKWIFLAGSPVAPSSRFLVLDGSGRIRGSFEEGLPAVSSEILDCAGAILREERLAAASGLK
jgi:cytochrome oxidase Cu insertion factor (SCO1/SenC/PrrC family)